MIKKNLIDCKNDIMHPNKGAVNFDLLYTVVYFIQSVFFYLSWCGNYRINASVAHRTEKKSRESFLTLKVREIIIRDTIESLTRKISLIYIFFSFKFDYVIINIVDE